MINELYLRVLVKSAFMFSCIIPCLLNYSYLPPTFWSG